MSKIVAEFDPAAQTSDTFNAGFPNGEGKIVVWNESDINLELAWGAFTTYCPAWTAVPYCISTNDVNIAWQQNSVLSSTGSPISKVTVEAYGTGEAIIGTFPLALNRHFVGNPITGTVTATTTMTQTLYNNGFPAPTQIISVGALNEGAASWSMWNDGTLQLFVRTAPNTYVQALILQIGEPMVVIGAGATHTVEVASKLQVDEALNLVLKQINDNAGHNLLDCNAPGWWAKNPGNPGPFHFQANGTNTDWVRTAESFGTGTSANGSANFNHGLKVAGVNTTPDHILITPTGGVLSYAVTAKNSTQFTLVANGVQTFDFMAIKAT